MGFGYFQNSPIPAQSLGPSHIAICAEFPTRSCQRHKISFPLDMIEITFISQLPPSPIRAAFKLPTNLPTFQKTVLTCSLTFCHKVLTRRCHLQNRCEGVSVSAARVFGQSFPRLAQPESNVARDWQDSSSVRPARDSRPAP